MNENTDFKAEYERKQKETLLGIGTARRLMGIVSILLSNIVGWQAWDVAILSTTWLGKDLSYAGIILTIVMLIAGVISIIERFSFGCAITCAILFFLGALSAIMLAEEYAWWYIWSIVSLLFSAMYVITAVIQK